MNLTSFDIVKAIINKFKNENIHYFSKSELENQLNYLSKNEKYNNLFYNNLDLTETINIFLMCGYLYSFKTDYDTIYIIKSDEKVNYNELLEEILDSYCYIKKICDNYKDLRFCLINPNNTYMNVKGMIEKNEVEWTLKTDGIIENKNIKLISGVKHCFKSPFSEHDVYFDIADFNIVDITNSSYVLRQKIVNNQLIESLLYTDEANDNINEVIKTYCKK